MSAPRGGAAQVVSRAKKPLNPFDPTLFFVTLFLTVSGICMLFSASYAVGIARHQSAFHYVWKQMVFAGIGLALMIACSKVNLITVRRLSFLLLLVTALLLVLVWSPFGLELSGARRWLKTWPFALQPSEVAKLTLILFIAHTLSIRQRSTRRMAGGSVEWWQEPLLRAALAIGLIAGLILFEPHLSVVVMLTAGAAVVCFLAGIPRRLLWAAIGACVLVGVIGLATAKDYQIKRIESWFGSALTCAEDPEVTPYQIIQSVKGVRAGGLVGVGFCEGKQKLLFLPSAHNDFIFSVVGEELGLLGTLFTLGLYVVILWRGFHIAYQSEDQFCSLLAAGLTTTVTLEAMVNIGVAINLLPTTGMALPFISYGGSSLIMNLVMVGFILNVSRHSSLQTWRGLHEDSARGRGNGRAHLPRADHRGSRGVRQPSRLHRVRWRP